jgi:hypothetical protein
MRKNAKIFQKRQNTSHFLGYLGLFLGMGMEIFEYLGMGMVIFWYSGLGSVLVNTQNQTQTQAFAWAHISGKG